MPASRAESSSSGALDLDVEIHLMAYHLGIIDTVDLGGKGNPKLNVLR